MIPAVTVSTIQRYSLLSTSKRSPICRLLHIFQYGTNSLALPLTRYWDDPPSFPLGYPTETPTSRWAVFKTLVGDYNDYNHPTRESLWTNQCNGIIEGFLTLLRCPGPLHTGWTCHGDHHARPEAKGWETGWVLDKVSSSTANSLWNPP